MTKKLVRKWRRGEEDSNQASSLPMYRLSVGYAAFLMIVDNGSLDFRQGYTEGMLSFMLSSFVNIKNKPVKGLIGPQLGFTIEGLDVSTMRDRSHSLPLRPFKIAILSINTKQSAKLKATLYPEANLATNPA